MKVTFQTCCGVDVHKSFLVATIIKTTGGIEPSYQKRRFSTFNNSIRSSIFLKMKSMLLLLIPSGLKLLKVIRMTQRIRNGLEICSV